MEIEAPCGKAELSSANPQRYGKGRAYGECARYAHSMFKKFVIQILLIIHFFTDLSFAEDIRDIQPPVSFPADYLLLYLLSGVLALVAIFYLARFLIKRFKKAERKKVVVKPSWVVAYERLEELRGQNLPSEGKFKEYYTSLSFLVREYIENRFQIKAPDMTTQEFLKFLKDSGDFREENKKLLEDFLNSCDLVKFAKYGPTINETEESYISAKRFVNNTKETEASVSGSMS